MRLALVVTVKNEKKLLRSNLFYHRYLGVDKFYVFLDNPSDQTELEIHNLPFVSIRKSIDGSEFSDKRYLDLFLEKRSTHHAARQCLNTYKATLLSREENIDWLISLDPDELIALDINYQQKDGLKEFFASLGKDIETVHFENLEAVQNTINEDCPFRNLSLFKNIGFNYNKKIFDPYQKKFYINKGFYFHSMGKSAIRVSVIAKPISVHGFASYDNNPLSCFKTKYLLHYSCFDFNDFIKKYRNFAQRPNTWVTGQEVKYFPHRLWCNIVNDENLTMGYKKEYFKKWIMFNKEDFKILEKIPSSLINIDFSQNIFKSLKK